MSKNPEQVISEVYFMLKDMSKELAGQTSSLASNSPLALDVPNFVADAFTRMDTSMKAVIMRNQNTSLIPELEALS